MSGVAYLLIGGFLGTAVGFVLCALLSMGAAPVAAKPPAAWISWSGGAYPPEGLLSDDIVQVRFTDGSRGSACVDTLSWMHWDARDDIVAYRRVGRDGELVNGRG